MPTLSQLLICLRMSVTWGPERAEGVYGGRGLTVEVLPKMKSAWDHRMGWRGQSRSGVRQKTSPTVEVRRIVSQRVAKVRASEA